MKKIYELLNEIQSREKQELLDALYKHGESVDGGFEVRFDGEEPLIIAGYLGEDPCDIVVTRAFVDFNGYIGLDGYDKNNSFSEYRDIEPDDIFVGHLTYVTEAVVESE